MYYIYNLSIKVKVKILERNFKEVFFVTFGFFADSKAKINSIRSIFSISYSFINP